MDEGETWASLFFSGSPPDILKTNQFEDKVFRPFFVEHDDWELGRWIDISRRLDSTTIQVFWLRVKGRRKYVGKVVCGEITRIQVLELITKYLVSLLFQARCRDSA